MQCEAVLVMLLQRFDDIALGAQLQMRVAEKWRDMADHLENYAR
jgi:hypothetical protein